MRAGILWRGVHKFKHLELIPGGKMIGMEVKPPTTDYFVDSTLGDDGNSGLAWGTGYALDTIQEAMDKITALATRGRARIFVAPAGYTEDITTPTNTAGPFCSLIAVSPTRRSTGAAWLFSATTSEPTLTVLARGWLIDGFEFDANTGDGCIFLSGANAKFAEIANCLFCGGYSGTSDFGVDTDNPNPLVVIRDSLFTGFGGIAITSTDCYTLQWEIAGCRFVNNQNHIFPKNSKGFGQSWIHDCAFEHTGGEYTATKKIWHQHGDCNIVGPNNFLGGNYDHAGGYRAGSNGHWRGNHSQDSENGSAQANPAA